MFILYRVVRGEAVLDEYESLVEAPLHATLRQAQVEQCLYKAGPLNNTLVSKELIY